MDLKNHCLFCLEGIVPYIIVPYSRRDEKDGGIIKGLPPDFQSLCSYLKMSLPKKGSTKSILSSSCDKLLCISCYGMVDRLNKLRMIRATPAIQKRIGEMLGGIREVVLAHDISADLSSSSRTRLEFEKKLGGCGIGRREENDCLEFVEMFQTAVKGLDLEGSGSGQDSRAELTPTNMSSSTLSEDRRREVISENDNPVNENNKEIGGVEMKIEVDEEDPDNIEGEGGPIADSRTDRVDSDSPYYPSDSSSSMENEGESNDDEDWKADIMTQPTKKRRNTKRQCQSSDEANPISCRTRKSVRLSSIKPSPKKKLKEDEPTPQVKCLDCDLSFTSYWARCIHRRQSHPQKFSTLKSLLASIPQGPIKKPGLRHSIRICTVCAEEVTEKTPSTLLRYMEHMLSHEEQSTSEATDPFSCPECDKQFNLKINLDLHLACIHEARLQVIRCTLCRQDTNYESREELIEHLKSAHDGDTVYSCKHCPMSFISFQVLILHMKKHIGCTRLLCPECIEVCTTMKDLHKHCGEAHSQLKEKYNCERCDKSYLDRQVLIQHMKRKHGSDRKKNHERPRNSRNHKCDQCENKFFESKSALRMHVESFHEKLRYPCPYCPQTYAARAVLSYHMRIHTRDGLFICEICSKEYSSKHLFNRHMGTIHATVENSKQMVCEECGKEFLGEVRLREHKWLAHPKVQKGPPAPAPPSPCPICGRQFTHPSNVKAHIKRKHGDSVQRPYKCVICKTCVREKGTLKTHLKLVHRLEAAEVEEKFKQGIAQGDS